MSLWQTNEVRSRNYLQRTYGDRFGVTFQLFGGSDSTKPDILVQKNGLPIFYVESKSEKAQSGQFVALANIRTRSFVFSPRNHSKPNSFTDQILAYMNQHFRDHVSPGTGGIKLALDPSLFASWITNYYRQKGVRFFIIPTKTSYAIFPLDSFEDYVDVDASYRLKGSGSSNPARKSYTAIRCVLQRQYGIVPTDTSTSDGKFFFTAPTEELNNAIFYLAPNRYLLAKRSINPSGTRYTYEVRKLSNTKHATVIFSITPKGRNQDPQDLRRFEQALQRY